MNIRYQGKTCTRVFPNTETLDAGFLALVRGYSHTSNLIASAVIHQPALGGFLDRMYDLTLKRKRRLLQRAIAEGGATEVAMHCLLRRHAIQDPWSGELSGRALTIRQTTDERFWASDLIHWGLQL